jgi:8-oxo-dGTP pyrophosphatase MutT (NUDIX family)
MTLTQTPLKASQPQMNGKEPLASGIFLTLERLLWTDQEGCLRKWEAVNRIDSTGAVVIIARLSNTGEYVLIRQFRPPAEAFVLEFPAGLIDDGEEASKAALRELKEETGYVGVVEKIYPPSFTSPGLSGETVRFVLVSIDMNLPENQSPESSPEPGEFMETLLVKSEEALSFIAQEEKRGVRCDSKTLTWFLALSAAK